MSTIAYARALGRIRPVSLVKIELQNSGPALYLSERNITVAGQAYEDYIKSVTAPAEEARRASNDTLNAPLLIEFKNDAWRAYAHLIEAGTLYPFEGARCTLSEAYLDDAGAPTEAAVVFIGQLDSPMQIDLAGFSCSVSSIEYSADRSL